MPWDFSLLKLPPQQLHELEHPGSRAVWLHGWPIRPTTPAEPTASGVLVLGSTQAASVVNQDELAARGLSCFQRRSGGGAVLLAPQSQIWIDVLIPRDDPLWEADLSQSSLWLGRVWQQTLAAAGLDCEVYEGPFEAGRYGSLACYASRAPGEVLHAGRKCVGISQRRTKQGARFQTSLLCRWDAAEFARLFDLPEGEIRQLAKSLEQLVAPLPIAAEASVEARLWADFQKFIAFF